MSLTNLAGRAVCCIAIVEGIECKIEIMTYATSLWQVGDSSEQNGAYKQKINKEKHTILDGRVDRCLGHMELVPTDIIPMVNKAWPVSFGCEITNKKAICDRGWYPYNRNLLNNEDLRMKMTKEDKKRKRKYFVCSPERTKTNYNVCHSTTSTITIYSS